MQVSQLGNIGNTIAPEVSYRLRRWGFLQGNAQTKFCNNLDVHILATTNLIPRRNCCTLMCENNRWFTVLPHFVSELETYFKSNAANTDCNFLQPEVWLSIEFDEPEEIPAAEKSRRKIYKCCVCKKITFQVLCANLRKSYNIGYTGGHPALHLFW